MEANKKTILMVLYSPQETGAPEFILRVREYKDEPDTLMAFAETSCYWSRIVSMEELGTRTENEWIKLMKDEARDY